MPWKRSYNLWSSNAAPDSSIKEEIYEKSPPIRYFGRMSKLQKVTAAISAILSGIMLILTSIALSFGYFTYKHFLIVSDINIFASLIGLITGVVGLLISRSSDRTLKRMTIAYFVMCIGSVIIDFVQLILMSIWILAVFVPSPMVKVFGVQQDWRVVVGVTWVHVLAMSAHLACNFESAAFVCNVWFCKKYEKIVAVVEMKTPIQNAGAGAEVIVQWDKSFDPLENAQSKKDKDMKQEIAQKEGAGPTPLVVKTKTSKQSVRAPVAIQEEDHVAEMQAFDTKSCGAKNPQQGPGERLGTGAASVDFMPPPFP